MRAYGWHGTLLTMLLLLVAGACRTWSESPVFVRSGSTANQRKQVAQAYVTEQSLSSLRSRLKQAYPALSDAQLQGLYLKWKIKPGDDETAAVVVVGVQGHSQQNDELVMAAVKLVEADINGPAQQR